MFPWLGQTDQPVDSERSRASVASLEERMQRTRSELERLQHEQAMGSAVAATPGLGTRVLVRRTGSQIGRLMRVPNGPTLQMRLDALKVAARKRLQNQHPFTKVFTATGDELQPDDIDLIDHDDVLYFAEAAVPWKPPPAQSAENAVRLCTAAYIGNLDSMRQLVVEEGCDIGAGDYDKRTALHLSASEGRLDLAKFILEELKADVSPVDRFGGTPLDDAVRHKHFAVEQYLRERGAKVGATATSASVTVAADLCDAAYAGNSAELSRLVHEEHFFVDASDYDKRTALHLAASEGHLDVVRLLVEELGARLSPVDRWDGTPLDDALRGNHASVETYLRSKGAKPLSFRSVVDEITATQQRGSGSQHGSQHGGGAAVWTEKTAALLCDAAASGKVEELRRLVLEEGWSVDSCDYDKRTPLHLASSEGHLDVVRLLIEDLGARRSLVDRWGKTPLDNAERLHHSAVVKYLRTKEAKTSQELTSAQATATDLCAAAAAGDVEQLRQLIQVEKLDVNDGSHDQRTALHLAASEGRLRMVTVLVEEFGAEPSPVDRWGRSPLDDAVHAKHAAVEEYLHRLLKDSKAARKVTEDDISRAALLCNAADGGKLDELRRLVLEDGFSPNLGDYDQRTALHLAASAGNLEVVVELVEELSAIASPADRWGNTPLDDAIRQGRADVEMYLKTRGATKTIYTTPIGETSRSPAAAAAALCDAAYVGNVPELTQLAKTQIEHEGPAVVNRGDYDARTPLHLAASEGRLDVAKTLVLEFGAHPSPEDRWGGTPLQDVLRFNTTRHLAVAEFLRSVHATRLPFRSVHFWQYADQDIEMSRLCVWVTRGETMMARRILLQTKAHGGFQLLREQLTATDRSFGSTVLHWAAHSGSVELIELLMQYANQLDMAPADFLDRPNLRDGSTALHIAARHGHADAVGFLMRVRADANRTNDLANSALHEACRNSHAEVAKVILQLQKNTKLHKKNTDDFTPLAAAVNAGDNQTVLVLLHADAPFNVPMRPALAREDVLESMRMSERSFPGAGLVKEALAARRLSVLRELLMWGRRRYKGGMEGTWKLGVLQLKEIETVIVDLWGGERIDLPDKEQTVELFTLLVLCLHSQERDYEELEDKLHEGSAVSYHDDGRGLSGDSFHSSQSFLPVLSALHVSVACRERALSLVRDTELSSRLRYAGAILELIACAILYGVHRLIKTTNATAWPGYDTLPKVFQRLLAPTIEFAARHECMIYLAYPLVMKNMADYFWPSPEHAMLAPPESLWEAAVERAKDGSSYVTQLMVNVAALPVLPFIPSGTEARMQRRLTHQMHNGERTPLGLFWLLPPGKALLWFISTLALALLLTLMPPRQESDGPLQPAEMVLAAYGFSWMVGEVQDVARMGLRRYLDDPFNVIDILAGVSMAVMTACFVLDAYADADALGIHEGHASRTSANISAEWAAGVRCVEGQPCSRPATHVLIGSASQSLACMLIYLRLLKVLYILPGVGLMLLMALRMLKDLQQFLVLLGLVLVAFVASLYTWSAFWAPRLSGLLVSAPHLSDSLDPTALPSFTGVLHVAWRLIDYALMTQSPSELEGVDPVETLAAGVLLIGVLFFILVQLLLLNLLIARFTKTFDTVFDLADLNTALVFARFCVTPEVEELVPAPFDIIRSVILKCYWLVGAVASGEILAICCRSSPSRHQVGPTAGQPPPASTALQLTTANLHPAHRPANAALSERSSSQFSARSARSVGSGIAAAVMATRSWAQPKMQRTRAGEASPRDGESFDGESSVHAGAAGMAPGMKLTRSATKYMSGADRPAPKHAGGERVGLVRDFITRALHHEVRLFPEQVVAFVDANQRRIEQSAGKALWS